MCLALQSAACHVDICQKLVASSSHRCCRTNAFNASQLNIFSIFRNSARWYQHTMLRYDVIFSDKLSQRARRHLEETRPSNDIARRPCSALKVSTSCLLTHFVYCAFCAKGETSLRAPETAKPQCATAGRFLEPLLDSLQAR